MRKLLFILFSLGYYTGYCQILDINQPLFSDEPFFNQIFIKTNKIKSITGSISSKKIRDIIRTKGLDYYYEFDNDGKLKLQLVSHLSNGLKDSTTVSYTYNPNGTVSVKRKNDSYGFYSHNYKYDESNHIVSQTYCRDENKFNSKTEFELKNQFVISTDSFSYEKTDATQTKKLYYNAYKKVYKVEMAYYNEYNYLIEEYTRFIIGNNKKKITYEYDEKGRLYKKHTFINIAENKKQTEVYTYDEIGNILYIKVYDNEKHKTTKEFLYDKNMLLSAQLIKDIESEFLRIIQYRYTFYDDNKFVEVLPLDSINNNQ